MSFFNFFELDYSLRFLIFNVNKLNKIHIYQYLMFVFVFLACMLLYVLLSV